MSVIEGLDLSYSGIEEISIDCLEPAFRLVASTLYRGAAPDSVWVIYFKGDVVAIYLDRDSAWSRLQYILFGLKSGFSTQFCQL